MADDKDTTGAAGAEAPAETMDETMAAAFDAANATDDAPEGDPAPVEAKASPAEGDDAPEGDDTTETTDDDQEATDGTKAAAKEATVEAPDGWSAEMKEAFAALPENVRDYVAARDKAAHSKLSEQGRELATLKPVSDTLERYRHTFEARGLDPHAAVNAMFEVQDRLDRDPVSAIRQIAQIYGVDLAQYAGQPQEDAPTGDANTAAVNQQIASLSQQLDAIRDETAQDRNSHTARELKENQDRVAEWSKGKPHFDAVRKRMAALMDAGEAADLDAAYEQAIWSNPEIRTKLEATKAKKAADQAAKDATVAKKRQRVNVGKAGDRAAPKKTWEEEVGVVWDEVAAG